ncbi:hypothetical protein [Pseudolysinimonas sp.]|uniref:hypothetical protein n=1 Tax=Pseudolysinimonas sp. TaxID=2680009 RepID=UPI0037833C70
MAELVETASSGGRVCAFCGSTATLTREHVFGDWLSKIGLGDEPAELVAGSLNQLGKKLGPTRPFQTKVKNVCATCNNGWMGRLEETAKRVLTPLVLGGSGQIERPDQGAIAAWIQKTALMAMYVSSAEDRANGHGLPPQEYALLYRNRDRMEPTANSKFWVGSYSGALRQGGVWVTPIAVNVDGYPEPEFAHGYSMTIALGAVVFHGVRFTELPFGHGVAASPPLVQIWPGSDDAAMPTEASVSNEEFLPVAQGRRLLLGDEGLSLRPLSSAINSPDSELVGTALRMPTPCGKGHFIFYPAAFAQDGMQGRFLWFHVSCDCGIAYLIHVRDDGAHVRSAGEPGRIVAEFEDLPGEELVYDDGTVPFTCKRDSKATG